LKIKPGDRLEIGIGDFLGKPGLISTPYAPLARALKPTDHLLLDDGHVELREHKGINAPNVPLPAAGITAKDETDLRAGLAAGVDLIALSFVQSKEDIARARAVAADAGRPRVPIVAKLERPEAISRLEEIADAADALM